MLASLSDKARAQAVCTKIPFQACQRRPPFDNRRHGAREQGRASPILPDPSKDRAHMEIDRARQEAKLWQQRHETIERTSRDAMTALQGRHDSAIDQARHLEQEIARQAGQIAALEKSLSEVYTVTAAKRKNSSATSKVITKRDQQKKSPSKGRTQSR